jgi:hypothetical protein
MLRCVSNLIYNIYQNERSIHIMLRSISFSNSYKLPIPNSLGQDIYRGCVEISVSDHEDDEWLCIPHLTFVFT